MTDEFEMMCADPITVKLEASFSFDVEGGDWGDDARICALGTIISEMFPGAFISMTSSDPLSRTRARGWDGTA